ncbi:Zinc/iron permease [Mortierella sp. GBAus27b]|nr:high-affinity Zn(2+) transporter zrt1 [Mortierella sp. GBA43]KAI8349546.1 Zinc/iron permease [Mortierella sp. GBAus27b]
MSLGALVNALHNIGSGLPRLSAECDGGKLDHTEYNVQLHVIGVAIILVSSTAGVFMPVIASRFHTLRLSSRLLTLGKQFGAGIILATAFIHTMPTAMSNLSSPCLGPVFSENYTAFGGLIILFSSLFMHWIEFVAMEHNQRRMREAAAERGVAIEDGRMDLGGLGATGVAAMPCPGHSGVMNDAICRRSSCSSSVSYCALDHHNNTPEAYRGHHHTAASDTSTARSSSSLIADVPTPSSAKSYGTVCSDSHHTKMTPTPAHEVVVNTGNHHHHYQEMGHSHAHGLELLEESQRKISTYILEAGVAAHSIIIGVSLGVSSGTEFMGLLTALSFHQFFEGFALGARIADLEFEKTSTHYLMALIFSLTTPIGAVLGIAISSTYQSTSATAILVEGVFDAVSSGILLYMGYVNLLAVEFNQNGEIRKEGSVMKQLSFFALWSGAAVMAFLGRFA